MTSRLHITGCRGVDGAPLEIFVSGGVFAIEEAPAGQQVAKVTLADCLAVPGLVDCHVHLDKTLLGGPWRPHRAGNSVEKRIAFERATRGAIEPDAEARGNELIKLAVSNGTVALRSHVDIDDDIELENFESILRLRERWHGKIAIQIVAFPQSGIVRCRGVRERLDEALRNGADGIGGLDPAVIDGDREAHLQFVFDAACRHGSFIDIHLHEPGDGGLISLRRIAEMTIEHGLAGRVAVSHAFCLGDAEPNTLSKMVELLAKAGVSIITSAPGAFPMPPVSLLRAAGVLVGAGSDNVRDLWSPFGNASMLERCMLVAYRSGWRTDEDLVSSLALSTRDARKILGLESLAIAPGMEATFAVFPSAHVSQAIVERPKPLLVVANGKILHDPTSLVTEPSI